MLFRSFAPADAEIQTIIPNEGEIVNAGYPVMNLIDTQDEWVVFNIREDKMTSICRFWLAMLQNLQDQTRPMQIILRK